MELPFGHYCVAVSDSNYAEAWLQADEELDIAFRVRGPMSRGLTWDCPTCGSPLEGPASMHLTPCPQCGSRSLAAGSVSGFSRRVRKVMVAGPPAAPELASAFFRGLASHLRAESHLIIDLSQAIMDSAAIGQLVLLHKKAKSKRTMVMVKLILTDESPIRETFRATRLDKVFSIFPTIDAALRALR